MFYSPAIPGGTLYIGSHKLNAIDLKAKKVVWSFETEGSRRTVLPIPNPTALQLRSSFFRLFL